MQHIQPFLASYAGTVESFGIKKIEERFDAICEKAEQFIKNMGYANKVRLDRSILAHTLMDYFSDIARIKDFHDIARTNSIKITSYEIQWLLRRKPLQILETKPDTIFANEQFALARILEYISPDVTDDAVFNDERIKFFLDFLFYYFKFRQVNAQALEMALIAFEAGKLFQQIKFPS